MARPSPRLPPVTSTLRAVFGAVLGAILVLLAAMRSLLASPLSLSALLAAHKLVGSGDLECRHKADRGRYFMTRQGFATELQDIVFQGDLLRRFVGRLPLALEHHIGDHDRTGDRL